MHHRFVGLVLEVGIPSAAEFVAGPFVDARELLFCGADLDAGFNTVCAQWAAAGNIPFFEDSLLHFGIA